MTDSMRRLAAVLVLACVVVCAAPHARGQETERRARKVDEFADIQLSDLMARLDYFANALTNEPGASGFIIVYRSRRDPEGLSGRVDDPMKRYLVESRGIPASRLATVDGGEASCFAVEFWLVPPGTAPTPRADAYTREFTDTESARKFDEYHYPLAHDDEGQPEIVLFGNSLEGFAAALHKQPRALGYVIAYPQYYVETWTGRRVGRLDPAGSATRMLREVRRALTREHGIPASRIRLVNGGHRRLRQVELWVVPRGVHAPIATPDAFPKKRAGR